MRKNLLLLSFFIFIIKTVFGQVVINELDCDTPGTDDQEFVELLSETPQMALDGFVLVCFNGSTSGMNSSYFALDLDGFTTDENGILVIGSNSVSPVPQLLIAPNIFQNGADAIAIYQADAEDFPEETVATIDNLVDVLLYDTSDSDDEDMIAIFSQDPRFSNIEQINEGPSNNTNSIQRFVDAEENVFYTATTPTPRQLNDGSGIIFNGISISVSENQYDEGESFEITFSTQNQVAQDLNFNIILNNEGFDNSDFTGNTAIIIPENQTTATTTLNLIDDTADEGDEVIRLRFDELPSGFVALNDNLEIRVVDNDFTVANFGTPLNPTFGNVTSTQPSGYYDSLDNTSGESLRQALQDIIANSNIVRAQTYADVTDILKSADQNPLNSNEVWLVYTESSRPKLDFQTSSDNTNKWNREHTYPRSWGGFFSIEEDDIADGIDIFWETKADSTRHGNSDAHALRAVDAVENSTRGNQHYGEYTGPTGNQGSFYGDVARSVLFMEIRYNDLSVVNGFPEGITGEMGDLETLLDWHRNDPPDDFEMNRNNIIYTWQFNRNPFIDQPDLVEYIWGENVGDLWQQQLSVDNFTTETLKLYPNPAKNELSISGLKNNATMAIYTISGQRVKTIGINPNKSIPLDLSSGIYVVNIKSEGNIWVKKLVVE
ncbi:MAG: endonuclease [Bacteroidota bacterium]